MFSAPLLLEVVSVSGVVAEAVTARAYPGLAGSFLKVPVLIEGWEQEGARTVAIFADSPVLVRVVSVCAISARHARDTTGESTILNLAALTFTIHHKASMATHYDEHSTTGRPTWDAENSG